MGIQMGAAPAQESNHVVMIVFHGVDQRRPVEAAKRKKRKKETIDYTRVCRVFRFEFSLVLDVHAGAIQQEIFHYVHVAQTTSQVQTATAVGVLYGKIDALFQDENDCCIYTRLG